MDKTLLIFDFDGTIADTLKLSKKILNKIRDKYHIPEVNSGDFVKDLQNINVFETLRKFGFGEESINEFLIFIRDEYSKESIESFPGMIDVIKNLKDNGTLLAVVSSNHTDSVNSFLKEHSLEEMFSYVLGGDINTSKVTNIKYLVNETETPIGNVSYIGDTSGDIIEAKEAKVKTIGVTWGFHDQKKIKDAAPDIVIQKPEELLEI